LNIFIKKRYIKSIGYLINISFVRLEKFNIMQLKKIEGKLKELLPDEVYEHTIKVKDYSYKLSKAYNFDSEKLALTAILHDCGKIYNEGEIISKAEDVGILITEIMFEDPIELLHAEISGYLAETMFNVKDKDIIHAIKTHSFGADEMGFLNKLLFVADKMNNDYDFEEYQIEEIEHLIFIDKNLDKAILKLFNILLKSLIKKDRFIHSQIVNSRNKILLSIKYENKI